MQWVELEALSREFQVLQSTMASDAPHRSANAVERARRIERKCDRQQFDAPAGISGRALIERAITEGARHASAQYPLAFLLIDLDNFRAVNQGLGHAAGDELLAQISVRLQQIVHWRDAFAHIGGDEFGLVLGRLRSASYAATIARRLLAALQAPFDVAGRELRISASIGISIFPTDEMLPADLRRCAEAAMYSAKEKGRGHFAQHTRAMTCAAEQQIILTGDLRYAIERNELELYYQPQVSPGGDLVGFEALLRWHHPSRGEISPAVFIPIAEASGLILPIGRWVLLEACRQCKAWQSPGGTSIRVAVNVSVAQFLQNDFYDLVIGAIDRFSIDRGCLELEITESLLGMDNGAAAEKIAALRKAGVRIAIDDFGTGYSSLAYLNRLPVDALKIDRSFVAAIVAGSADACGRCPIICAVMALARDLNLGVTAEGVETADQREYLSAIGCDQLQGYLIGRPHPAWVATSLLQQFRAGAGKTPD